MALSKKNQRTLERIFHDPIRSDVEWKEIEKLLFALGAEISEGKGDLTKRIPVRSKDEIGVIAENFNKFIESFFVIHKRKKY